METPAETLEALKKASDALAVIRDYFAERNEIFIGSIFWEKSSESDTTWHNTISTSAQEADYYKATALWAHSNVEYTSKSKS